MAKKSETKDVAIKDNTEIALYKDMFDAEESMREIDARLQQIGILHAGAAMFSMPDESRVQKFDAVILDFNRANAWWEKPFAETGAGTPPDCFSMDGLTLDPTSENPQAVDGVCKTCPNNQFGSGGERSKACKNMKRMHVMLPGAVLPFRITVPPSSLKVVDNYVSLMVSQGLPYFCVVTEFSLKTVPNKDGIDYSELVLTRGDIIPLEEAKTMKQARDQWMETMRGQPIDSEEMAG